MDESEAMICNDAKDYIVYYTRDCPPNAKVLAYDDETKANPKLNLG